jgi:dynein heavy chain
MREICNTLIRQACKYLSGDRIFEMIEQEQSRQAVEMLRTTLRVFGQFKSTYFDYKAKANEEVPQNKWSKVQNNAIFIRLDSFLERCHDILELTQTIMQFSKLAKIEVGGTKGKTLTTSVMQIFSDFQSTVDAIKNVDYDIMDLDVKQFEEAWYDFRSRSKELERRLGSVMTQGFDDCTTITGQFKLLDSFDSLVNRPIIADELERKYVELINSYSEDLHHVQHIFMESREDPPISHNLPPIAGALSWCRGLHERVRLPMDKLKLLDRKIMEREEAREVIAEYTTFLGHLADFERSKIDAWGESIESSSQAKLKNPLLRKEEDLAHQSNMGLLYVNFDPLLVRLLREVKYFLLLGLQVPESALEIFGRSEVFRRHMGNLDLIVNMYNNIQTSLLPVERPLLRNQTEKIDRLLAQGIGAATASSGKNKGKSLNWKSNGIELFINEAMAEVREVDETLVVMKANLKRVEELLDTWSASSLFSRYNKASTVNDFEQLQKQVRSQRYHIIKEGGSEIHKLLKDTNKKLKVSQGLPDWRAYVDFINNIVVGGLVQVIIVSLEVVEQQIDPANITRQNLAPMIEIELDLFGGNVHFLPEVGFVSTSDADKQGIRNIVQGWIDSFVAVSAVFKRLDSGEGNYLKEMQDDPYVQMLLASINSLLGGMEEKGNAYRKTYEQYEYLWSTDLNEMFAQFLEDAVIKEVPNKGDGEVDDAEGKGEEEGEEKGEDVEVPLDLAKFDKKIREYLEVQSEIADLKPVHDMDFLRINAQPIKQALGTWVTKWMYLYTQHLQTHIVSKLQDVASFIQTVNAGLDIKPDNQASLMEVMTHIRDVRKRMHFMENTFQPLRDMVMLLKTHGISMELGMVGSMQALDFLEAAPLEWDNTVNKTFRVKEEIQPLQNAMVETIKSDINAFSGRMETFVKEFHANGPFEWSPQEGDNVHSVYSKIDEYQVKLVKMETEAQAFTELEELFELTSSRHTRLKDMRMELQLLKMVWDTICLVQFLFSSWKSTLWADIDTEVLLDETKMLQTQIKKLPRRVRDWDVYQNLEAEVRNMATVLPLVHELHSPAMRDRHWKALITVPGTSSARCIQLQRSASI